MIDTPNIGDLVHVRHRGEWLVGYIIVVEGKDFIVRLYDDTVPDKRLRINRFQTIDQRGWVFDKVPNTCNG